MKILFLSRWFPYPPTNGSKLRIFNLLRGLAEHHEVTLVTFAEQPGLPLDTEPLRPYCRAVYVVPWKPFNPQSWRARLGFLSLAPRSVVDTYSLAMQQQIEQVLATAAIDLVIASEVDMAVYSRSFRQVPALLDELQVAVLYERFLHAKSWRRLRHGLTWAKHRFYLKSVLANFQACTVASPRERELLAQTLASERGIEVIPNGVDLDRYSPQPVQPQPNTLIFTGAFSFGPNYEAMVWFLEKVYPSILAQIPEVQLAITGDHSGRPLPTMNRVTLTGFVPDVRPLVAAAWGSIVPLFTGGGTRLKILEAMALGTPVVATPKGAEGLHVRHDEHLLIADSAEAFAQAVVRLMQNPALRQRLSEQALQLVRTTYGWNVIMPDFLRLVERVAAAHPHRV